MTLSNLLFRLPAWTLGFLLAGMGIFNLFPQLNIFSGILTPICTAVVLLTHLPLLVFSYPKTKQATRMMWVILYLCFVFFISMLANDITDYGLWKFAGFLCLSVVPVYLIYNFYRNNNLLLKSLFQALLVFSIIPTIIVAIAIQEYGFIGLRWNLLKTGKDIIGLSRGMGFGAIIYFVGFFCWNGFFKKSAGLVIVVMMFLGQILLQERAPLLGTVVAFIFVVVFILRSRVVSASKFSWLALLFLSLVLLIGLKFPYLEHRFSVVNVLTDTRVDILEYTLTTIENMNWLTGEGLGNFGYYNNTLGTRQFAHNIFLETFLETGLLGVSALVYTVLFSILQILKKSNIEYNDLSSRSIFIFFLINSQASGDVVTNYMLFVSLMILLVVQITDKNDLVPNCRILMWGKQK
jgi:O-antigen ligase